MSGLNFGRYKPSPNRCLQPMAFHFGKKRPVFSGALLPGFAGITTRSARIAALGLQQRRGG